MPLYEVTSEAFDRIPETTFADLKIQERDDIQRLLRSQINVIADDLFVLTEEFGDWEDSKRRIDLLAIDKEANLVVIELKRSVDGGHMELQAIRYASMIANMTFERAVQIHSGFLDRTGGDASTAEDRILTFLDWEAPDEEKFAADTRILLVSADFGKELTTAVLWLRERDVDIRCIRIKPYSRNGLKLVDVQQIIPLPETIDYQIQLREKEQKGRQERGERYEMCTRFWKGVIALARVKGTRHANITPGEHSYIAASSGISGLSFNYVILQKSGAVELYIDRGDTAGNKMVFDTLLAKQVEIETTFGEPLSWERLDEKRACRIKHVLTTGGYRSPEAEWPQIQHEMVDWMIRLESALRTHLDGLRL